MENFLQFYQHLPSKISSVAISIGSFKIDWYSIMYIVGFVAVYGLLKNRIKKGEDVSYNFHLTLDSIFDLLIYIFIGLIIGARLGYVFFYNFSYYAANPLAIISPFDPATHNFIGIYGMSYHGGLIGSLVATWIFSRKRKISFWDLGNFVAPAIPAGYFFGRIGNFLNGELWGNQTTSFLGMYFPGDHTGILRHPSQLYEALLEGLVLFLILWSARNKKALENNMLGLYIVGYAVVRIIVEFFREPDQQIGYIAGFLTLGQILSLAMLILGLILIYSQRRKKMI